LQFDQFPSNRLGGGVTFLVGGVTLFVKVLQVRDGGLWIDVGEVEARCLDGPDQHTKLCSPIADMIIANDGGTGKVEEAGDGLTDNGGADVADVHFLGRIGGAEIDDGDAPGKATTGPRAQGLL
jgi:hypothetical protein